MAACCVQYYDQITCRTVTCYQSKCSRGGLEPSSLMGAIIASSKIYVIVVCQPTPQRRKTPSTVTTQVLENTPRMTIPCCYCDQFHTPNNCDTVIIKVEAHHV